MSSTRALSCAWCVQRVRYGLDLLGAPSGQVGTLRDVLPQKAALFSFEPRCHGLWGSAKKTLTSDSIVKRAWSDSSLQRSHVNDPQVGGWSGHGPIDCIGHGDGAVAGQRGTVLRSGSEPLALHARQVDEYDESA